MIMVSIYIFVIKCCYWCRLTVMTEWSNDNAGDVSVCVRWTRHVDQSSSGGARRAGPATAVSCRAACENLTSCVGVDWRDRDSSCWLHRSVSNLLPTNTRTTPGVTQYRLSRDCTPPSAGSRLDANFWQNFALKSGIFVVNLNQVLHYHKSLCSPLSRAGPKNCRIVPIRLARAQTRFLFWNGTFITNWYTRCFIKRHSYCFFYNSVKW